MGITKDMSKTDIPTDRVNWMAIVKESKHPVPLDVANLMFNVQWLFAEECVEGDYSRTLQSLRYMNCTEKAKSLRTTMTSVPKVLF